MTQILPLCPAVLRTRKENSFSFGFHPSEVAWVGQHPVPLAITKLSSVVLLCSAGEALFECRFLVMCCRGIGCLVKITSYCECYYDVNCAL